MGTYRVEVGRDADPYAGIVISYALGGRPLAEQASRGFAELAVSPDGLNGWLRFLAFGESDWRLRGEGPVRICRAAADGAERSAVPEF